MRDRTHSMGCACGSCPSATVFDRPFRWIVIGCLIVVSGMMLGAFAPPEVIYAAVVGGLG